jgi:hypothetical protein
VVNAILTALPEIEIPGLPDLSDLNRIWLNIESYLFTKFGALFNIDVPWVNLNALKAIIDEIIKSLPS